jgi:hypothetical protein
MEHVHSGVRERREPALQLFWIFQHAVSVVAELEL